MVQYNRLLLIKLNSKMKKITKKQRQAKIGFFGKISSWKKMKFDPNKLFNKSY